MTQQLNLAVAQQLQRRRLDIKAGTNGWGLVSGQLQYNGPELVVTLVTEDDQERRQSYNLPVTLKGKVHELVKLPNVNLAWLEARSEGEVNGLDTLAISFPGLLFSRYLMWRRLYNTYTTVSKPQRRLLGLRPLPMVLTPYRAYALIGKSRYYTASPDYPEWIAQSERFTPSVARRLKRFAKRHRLHQIRLQVLIDARDCPSPDLVEQTLQSLRQQKEIKAHCQVLTNASVETEWTHKPGNQEGIIDHPSALLEQGLEHDWVFVVQAGTRLAPWALAWFAAEASNENVRFIYADHDYLDQGTRVAPQFKPDWSPELARCSGYVGTAFALHGHDFVRVIKRHGFTSLYQLMLDSTATMADNSVQHIPAVLCHYASAEAEPVCRQALEQHLHQHHIGAKVIDQGAFFRLRYSLPALLPKVSIVVPTRDALYYLKTCVDNLLQKTTWPNYELLIVDNQSCEPETLAYFEQLAQHENVKVLPYNTAFNFSAINNFAVAQASGEIICLLNNDTEVISPDWLEEMVSRLLQPGVGVVGTRLYFSDGRVQHAGDVLGPGGCAMHLHGIIDADDPGYMHRAVLAQDLSAVTAACLVTHKSLYQALGGLNEANLSVAFNDVDYCLKVREAGQRVIYTPYAELYHHESVSRGKDDSPEKQARAKRESEYMQARWGHIIERDPFYNPNLNYSQPDFRLGKIPRIDWPW